MDSPAPGRVGPAGKVHPRPPGVARSALSRRPRPRNAAAAHTRARPKKRCQAASSIALSRFSSDVHQKTLASAGCASRSSRRVTVSCTKWTVDVSAAMTSIQPSAMRLYTRAEDGAHSWIAANSATCIAAPINVTMSATAHAGSCGTPVAISLARTAAKYTTHTGRLVPTRTTTRAAARTADPRWTLVPRRALPGGTARHGGRPRLERPWVEVRRALP
jgi:hypothetical protein